MNKLKRSIGAITLLVLLASPSASAHPMGNFSINHHSTLTPSARSLDIHYILDFAEIPTFQMFADTTAIRGFAKDWTSQLQLETDGKPLSLELIDFNFTSLPGAGGLATIRVEMKLRSNWSSPPATVHFKDNNFPDRIGWKEIVVPGEIDRSDRLNAYPSDMLPTAPNDVEATFLVPASSPVSSEVQPQGSAIPEPDRLAQILTEEILPLRLILFGCAIAFVLGALHALSPGHGKTVVAAYLVGNRGTARHALFLGGVVTFTHTIGVFLLGFVTLYLSRYVVPERLYPWVGFISGLTILAIGASLFHQRLGHHLDHDHGSDGHSHEVPEGITFRNLLALGFSGGIVPCPSALVVLLSAIALHRVGIGLLFIVAFSLGLASVLVGIGILVVRAGRFLSRFDSSHAAARYFPILSAAIISVIGLAVAIQSLTGASILAATSALNGGALAVLALGLVLGLKHATDVDHVVAVTTFVSQERSILRSCWIGAFWGLGHTLSLAIAGLIVIGLRVNIPEWLAARLEFGVAVMLVGLGARALLKAPRADAEIRRHGHGLKPLLVGAVHGAAGSAALMLLVLSTIQSPLEGFLYILIFGAGSILGMLAISFLLAIPLRWAAVKVGSSYRPIQVMAGVFSCVFGLFLGAQIWLTLP